MKAISINELLELDLVKPKSIWGPLSTHNMMLVFGPRGVAKTRFATKLGYTLAAGGKFLKWDCDGGLRVGYVDAEMGQLAMRERVLEAAANSPFSVIGDNFKVFSYEQCDPPIIWNLSSPIDQVKYDELFLDLDVIIIDNLLGCVRPTSNRDTDFDQWQRVQQWAFKHRSSGKTIIFMHHSAKTGDQFGTSTKENPQDLVIHLKPVKDPYSVAGAQFELHFTKYREVLASDVPPLHVTYIRGDDGVSRWSWSPLTQSLEDKIMALKAAGYTKRDAAKELCISLFQTSQLWELDG